MVHLRKCPWMAVLVAHTYTPGWNEAMRPSSLRASCLPSWAPPNRARSESWPVNDDVDAWPPVLEYTPELRTSTLRGVSVVRIRERAPNPMS